MFDFLETLNGLEYYHNHSAFIYYHRFQIIMEFFLIRKDILGSDIYKNALNLFHSSLSIVKSMKCLYCRLNCIVAFNNNYLITLSSTEFI